MIRVTSYRSARDTSGTAHPPMAWPAFCGWIAEQAATQYPAPRNDYKAARDAAKARMAAFVCATFSGPRSNATVGDHTALVIDVDRIDDEPALFAAMARWRCIAYESPSSGLPGEGLRLRIVAALPKPYPAHAVPEARAAFARELGLDPELCGTSKAAAPSQIMFIGGFSPRRVWTYEGRVWSPPVPSAALECEQPAGSDPSEPMWSATDVPRLGKLALEIEPETPGGLRRGGRDVSRAIGGWLARRGYHPDAIAEAVLQLPSDQPDVRAEQARETALQYYAGDPRAAGYATLEQRYGEAAMAAVEADLDPWVSRVLASWPPPRPTQPVAADSAEVTGSSAEDALAALPEWVSAHVRACQEELRTPLALNIANALGTLAAAVSGRLKVRIHANYTAHTCLFVCSVAPPGELKSPSFRLCTAPIKAWVAERQDAERDDLQKRLNDRAAKVKLKDKLIREHVAQWAEYAEAQQSDDLTKVSIDLMAPEPVPFEFLVEDCTPEALSDLLATHGRVACLSSDASKVFSVLGGQYSKGTADLGVWLEAYDGSMPKVHRIGRTSKTVEPRHTQTTLAAVLSIQPQVLERITGNAAMVGEGLVQRFCWVVCQSEGRRWAEGEIPTPVPEPIAETWDAGIRFLLDLPSVEVKLSVGAFSAYIAWRDELEGRLRGGDLAGEVSGWASKHLERTAHISAVLWAADGAEGEISAEHMARAVAIGRWLIPQALTALQGADTEDEQSVLRWVGKVAQLLHNDTHAWIKYSDLTYRISPKRLRQNTDKVLRPLLRDLVGRSALEATAQAHGNAEMPKYRIPK